MVCLSESLNPISAEKILHKLMLKNMFIKKSFFLSHLSMRKEIKFLLSGTVFQTDAVEHYLYQIARSRKLTGKCVIGINYRLEAMSKTETFIAQLSAHFAVIYPNKITELPICKEYNKDYRVKLTSFIFSNNRPFVENERAIAFFSFFRK